MPVTLLAEDQDHVVVSGAITDKDEVAVSGISALRGILLGSEPELCSSVWSPSRFRSACLSP